MVAVFFIALIVPAMLIMGGIVAFVILPVKVGIAVAVLAFLLAVGVFSWFVGSIDLSH